ncbi:hypothetical protein JG687_00006837 [Phytophthora cactorum]|uniref:Uncharacterized protein n=1 Tax=Phytophthora cactorum TaxID=29920 RepID=A0A8T1UJY5_9STRA|nr:hypothetical protein GQ600_3633 [Phytophthora cactorum]KAG6962950.1 hypothetical protein JG687_00006837 [Phytophthora cactorum]
MGMSRSYVMEITTEVVRVLNMTSSDIISFPRSRWGWDTVEAKFASRHGYPGIVSDCNICSVVEL